MRHVERTRILVHVIDGSSRDPEWDYDVIREELRAGNTPHASIKAGYEKAWATIVDANVTHLISGVALFALGSGPIRGFALVLCVGIITSVFTAVTVSEAIVHLVYGRQRKLQTLSI